MTPFARLTESLVAALVVDLPAALGPWRGSTLYTVCLGTDSDPMTIVPMAHTEERLAALAPGADEEYLRWCWSEWAEGLAAPSVAAVTRQMEALRRDPALGDARARSGGCFRAMIDALDDERTRAAIRSVDASWDPVLHLQSSDPGGLDALHGRLSVEQLNPAHPRQDLVESLRRFMA